MTISAYTAAFCTKQIFWVVFQGQSHCSCEDHSIEGFPESEKKATDTPDEAIQRPSWTQLLPVSLLCSLLFQSLQEIMQPYSLLHLDWIIVCHFDPCHRFTIAALG